MILRELLAEDGMTTLTAFAQRAHLTKSHAWNLWYGRASLGLNLAKRIAQQTGIPLARLIEVEPTPPRTVVKGARTVGRLGRDRSRRIGSHDARHRLCHPGRGGGMTTPDYETNFDAWAAQQAAALRAKDWAALDLEHLAEEVEDLRKVERHAICSRLHLAVSHLLKWRYQPERRSESMVTIGTPGWKCMTRCRCAKSTASRYIHHVRTGVSASAAQNFDHTGPAGRAPDS
jgi:hypothetical protein